MAISIHDVEHVAVLARLSFTDEEKEDGSHWSSTRSWRTWTISILSIRNRSSRSRT